MTRIFPEILRFTFWFKCQFIQITQHIPRTVNLRLSKTVSIIPLFNLTLILNIPGILQKPLYLFIGKSKIITESFIRNCICHKIIGSSKNTFFGNAQTSCNHRKLKCCIILQCLAHHGADHIQHFIVICLASRFRHRHIVLINKQNHLFSIIYLHHTH